RTGEVLGSAMQLPGDFRAKLRSTIDPKTLSPLISGKFAEVFSQLEFQESPEIRLNMSGASPDPSTTETNGEIKLGHTRFRGIPLNSATSKVRLKDRALTCEQFNVERDEGSGAGTF